MSPARYGIFIPILAVLAAMLPALSVPSDAPDFSKMGGEVRWARLKTQSPTWDRHARSDPVLLEFMHTSASLNIDEQWYAADVEDLPAMCAYPFLFSEGIHHVTDQRGLDNLREYLQRDGFIFIDSCINTEVNPDPDVFLELEIATLKSILPDAHVERIPDNSPIFHICYTLPGGLPHTYMRNRYNPAWAKHGLYAVTSHHRLVSIISLSGLQCGWDNMYPSHPEHRIDCMKMMLNIYAYATTH